MSVKYGSVAGFVYRGLQPLAEGAPPMADVPSEAGPRIACSNGRVFASAAEAALRTGVPEAMVERAVEDSKPVGGMAFWEVGA